MTLRCLYSQFVSTHRMVAWYLCIYGYKQCSTITTTGRQADYWLQLVVNKLKCKLSCDTRNLASSTSFKVNYWRYWLILKMNTEMYTSQFGSLFMVEQNRYVKRNVSLYDLLSIYVNCLPHSRNKGSNSNVLQTI